MAHRTISDEEFLGIALDLFRTYGYEGVSLKQLADATGLEKASLYYRYPGGKEEIVMAVATHVASGLKTHLFDLLSGPGATRKRVLAAVESLRQFYAGGTKSCLTDVLSIPGTPEPLRAAIKTMMQAWIDAYVGVAKESGMTTAVARSRAEESIVRFEGALILSRVMGETASFDRVLKLLPDLLTVA